MHFSMINSISSPTHSYVSGNAAKISSSVTIPGYYSSDLISTMLQSIYGTATIKIKNL